MDTTVEYRIIARRTRKKLFRKRQWRWHVVRMFCHHNEWFLDESKRLYRNLATEQEAKDLVVAEMVADKMIPDRHDNEPPPF